MLYIETPTDILKAGSFLVKDMFAFRKFHPGLERNLAEFISNTIVCLNCFENRVKCVPRLQVLFL